MSGVRQPELITISSKGADCELDGCNEFLASGSAPPSNLVVSFLIEGWSSLYRKTPGGIAPPTRPEFGQLVGYLITTAQYVPVLESFEVVLQLPYFLAVSHHVDIVACPLLVSLADNQK